MLHIENIAPYALTYAFIVARAVNGLLWFYGAWNDRDTAQAVACELGNGVVIPREVVEG